MYYLHIHFLLETFRAGVIRSTVALRIKRVMTIWRKWCVTRFKIGRILNHWWWWCFTSLKHTSSSWWYIWKSSCRTWYHICVSWWGSTIGKWILNIWYWKWRRGKCSRGWCWAEIVWSNTVGKWSGWATHTSKRGAIFPVFLEFDLRVKLVIGRRNGQTGAGTVWIWVGGYLSHVPLLCVGEGCNPRVWITCF